MIVINTFGSKFNQKVLKGQELCKVDEVRSLILAAFHLYK